MENLPVYISLALGLATFLVGYFFFRASNYLIIVLIILLVWLLIQSIAGLSGFYTITNTIPPRFLLALFPPLLLIVLLFLTRKGLHFVDGLDLKTLTILHIVRIPVELVLFWLFVHKTVPELMTFEGRNYDFLSGLTSPIVYYFGFIKNRLGPRFLLFWNLVCLGLLFNIVINAILSFPFTFQKFAFDQPNIALLYFPFIWLPSFIVPVVMLSHLAAIRQLVIRLKTTSISF